MNPKKHKEFKKGIAEEVSVHPQVVDDFIAFYYSKLRKKLSQLDYPRINVKKNKSMLGNIAKRTYNGYAKSENIIKNIELMSAALDQMEKDILKKKNFKNKKND